MINFIDYTKFKQDLKNFNFDVKKNIKRLLTQQNGDYACYYLAIICFIEGYLRLELKQPFNDDRNSEKQSLNDLLYMYQNSLPENSPAIRLVSQIRFFAITSSYTPEYYNSKSESDTIYYSSANRIRHSFTSVNKNEIASLIEVFVHFAEHFKFNNDDVKSLLNNKKIFGHQMNQTVDSESVKTENEIFELSKKLNAKIKNDPDYLKIIQNLKKEDMDNLSDEMLDFLSQRENLKLNQYKLAEYSGSWRSYQLDASKFTEEQLLIKNTILNSITNEEKQNYVILGGPGTGKTILLLDLLQNIINLTKNKNLDVELLTYTNSLNKYNRFLAKSISFSEKCDIDTITSKINTFDDFIQSKAEKILNRKIFRISIDSDFEDENSQYILSLIKIPENFEYTTSYILKQAINEIWSMQPNKEEYVDGDPNRDKIWNIVKDLEFSLDQLSSEKPILYEYACYKLTKKDISSSFKTDYLLVDEAQDLTSTKLCLVSKFSKRNYILSGDLAQSIFIKNGLSWNALDKKLIKTGDADFIDLRLRKNFRSTEPIQNLAHELFKHEDFCIKIDDVYSEGFMPGPMPAYTITPSFDAAMNDIVKKINELKTNTMTFNNDICIIASNDEELRAIQKALGSIPSSFIYQDDFNFENNMDTVKLSTVQNIKGIDCTTVFLLISNNFINMKTNGHLDYFAQLNSLYASITRAMNWLKIYIANEDNLIEEKETVIPILLDVLEKKAIEEPYIVDDN